MRRDLQAQLKTTYPALFDDDDKELQFKRFGFDVGDGWFSIIDAALACANNRRLVTRRKLTLVDCKQKSGTLRLSFCGGVDNHLRGALEMALLQSERTCERCGAHRRSTDRGTNIRCAACGQA